MNEIEIIQKLGVVPVVVLNDAKDALPLAEALCDGGLPWRKRSGLLTALIGKRAAMSAETLLTVL